MDAYDHIQSATLEADNPPQSSAKPDPNNLNLDTTANSEPGNLTTDLQDAYKSFSASPWGAKLGGFFGTVVKQGESIYQGARDEATIASEEALKGFADLRSTIVSRARSMSLGESGPDTSAAGAAAQTEITTAETERQKVSGGEGQAKDAPPSVAGVTATASSSQSTLTAPDTEGLVARFRAEAEKRLKDIQRAEDAADEALLKFGTNIRNFLRDAVTVSAPSEEEQEAARQSGGNTGQSKVLFESKDAEGKRVIHTTRFDAQLHVIHCSLDSFLRDPASGEYGKWKESFDVEGKTGEISGDLGKYEELRRAMERLVPEKVEYDVFWCRYYFLRMVIESEEKRRREMLKGAALNSEKEVSWDEDSDSEPSTPQPKPAAATITTTTTTATNPSTSPSKKSTNESQPAEPLSSSVATLEPLEPRKSQDQHSTSGSDASYDLVSGATSKTPSSPKEENGVKKTAAAAVGAGASETVKEESDEEDWE